MAPACATRSIIQLVLVLLLVRPIKTATYAQASAHDPCALRTHLLMLSSVLHSQMSLLMCCIVSSISAYLQYTKVSSREALQWLIIGFLSVSLGLSMHVPIPSQMLELPSTYRQSPKCARLLASVLLQLHAQLLVTTEAGSATAVSGCCRRQERCKDCAQHCRTSLSQLTKP